MGRIKNYLVTGLIFFIPIVVTIYVIYWLFNTLDNFLFPFYRFFFSDILSLELADLFFLLPGISILITLILITAGGFFIRKTIGQRLISKAELYVERVPILRELYSSLKQLTSAIFVSDKGFKQVVIVEYPRKGIYTLGLVTGTELTEIQEKTQEKVISVYVPTAPNPTSGMMMFVPKNELIKLDISVNQALRLIISGGFTPPKNEVKDPLNTKK